MTTATHTADEIAALAQLEAGVRRTDVLLATLTGLAGELISANQPDPYGRRHLRLVPPLPDRDDETPLPQ